MDKKELKIKDKAILLVILIAIAALVNFILPQKTTNHNLIKNASTSKEAQKKQNNVIDCSQKAQKENSSPCLYIGCNSLF